MPTTITAADLMNEARYFLLEAAEAFKVEGDRHREMRARQIAREVAGEDQELQDRVWAALPRPTMHRQRPEVIADNARVGRSVVHAVLHALRDQGRATSGGGWWRQS